MNKDRSTNELIVYFVLGVGISFLSTLLYGSLHILIRVAIAIAPSIIILAIRKNFKSRGFLTSLGHTIPYSIAMFVLEQPIIFALEDEYLV